MSHSPSPIVFHQMPTPPVTVEFNQEDIDDQYEEELSSEEARVKTLSKEIVDSILPRDDEVEQVQEDQRTKNERVLEAIRESLKNDRVVDETEMNNDIDKFTTDSIKTELNNDIDQFTTDSTKNNLFEMKKTPDQPSTPTSTPEQLSGRASVEANDFKPVIITTTNTTSIVEQSSNDDWPTGPSVGVAEQSKDDTKPFGQFNNAVFEPSEVEIPIKFEPNQPLKKKVDKREADSEEEEEEEEDSEPIQTRPAFKVGIKPTMPQPETTTITTEVEKSSASPIPPASASITASTVVATPAGVAHVEIEQTKSSPQAPAPSSISPVKEPEKPKSSMEVSIPTIVTTPSPMNISPAHVAVPRAEPVNEPKPSPVKSTVETKPVAPPRKTESSPSKKQAEPSPSENNESSPSSPSQQPKRRFCSIL